MNKKISKVFTKAYRTRYSDINASGLLNPADCARYIIDTAYDWGEFLGLGHTKSNELGLYWVVRENEIHLFEHLHFMEEFDFTIWMFEWKRVRGIRAFEIKRKRDGALITNGTQKLVCLDVNTQRLVTPPEELIKNFRLDEPKEIPSQRFPKIQSAPEAAFTSQQRATWQDIDMLDMVNNAVYISYAEEAVTQALTAYGWSPSGLKANGMAMATKRVHIQYKTSAVWGDILDMTTFPIGLTDSSCSQYVSMTRVADKAAIADCILDVELVESATKKTQTFPETLIKSLRKDIHPSIKTGKEM